MYDDVNILLPVIYLCIILNRGNKVYNRMITETLMPINLGSAREVFHDISILFTWAAPHVTR